MRVWVYVEGRSDDLALKALWNDWIEELNKNGWGIRIIALKDKTKYFELIGNRVAEKLITESRDLVVGLPDLYPNISYAETKYQHHGLSDIQSLQERLVSKSLERKVSAPKLNSHLDRFYASALKHDLEMLLLAAEKNLLERLNSGKKGQWIRPPENQNQNRPPVRVIEELFLRDRKKAYRKTIDAPAILKSANLQEVLFDRNGHSKCPTFQETLDWIGRKTGVPAY